MQAKVYIPKAGSVVAMQVPPRSAALQAQALPGIRQMLRQPEAVLDSETGALRMPVEDGVGGEDEIAQAGDWLVLEGGDLTIFSGEEFAEAFVDPLLTDPEGKRGVMPPDLNMPPILFAAADRLANDPQWPAQAHQALVGVFVHYAQRSLPQGFVGLPIDRLWRLDRADYEKLQQLFPNLPDMPAVISLDTSIGARH